MNGRFLKAESKYFTHTHTKRVVHKSCHVLAQVVCSGPPSAEAWVPSQCSPHGICVGQSGTGTVSSQSNSEFI
jgi:hypothetical protein